MHCRRPTSAVAVVIAAVLLLSPARRPPAYASAGCSTTATTTTTASASSAAARRRGSSSSFRHAAFVAHRRRVGGGKRTTGPSCEPPSRGRTFRSSSLPSPPSSPLASATARGGGDRGHDAARRDSYNVLYQKVLWAPKESSAAHVGGGLFLLDLVAYLQRVFELPSDLPMPYEVAVPEDDDDDDASNDPSADGRAVLVIDSPLSNDPSEARLEVEVIGIFPDNDGDGGEIRSGPTMAMVALKKKRRDSNNGSNGVAGGLFAASEKSIVRCLDRGLQDLEEGRVAVPQYEASSDDDGPTYDDDVGGRFDDDDEVDAAMKRMGYQNSVDAAKTSSQTESDRRKEKAPEGPVNIERDGLGNVIIDAVAKKEKPRGAKQEAKKEKSKFDGAVEGAKSAGRSPSRSAAEKAPAMPGRRSRMPLRGDDDYAIQMARRRARAMMTTARAGSATSSAEGTVAISGGEGDFAVMAARRKGAASRLKESTEKTKEKSDGRNLTKGEERDEGNASPSVAKNVRKVQDLSGDETFLKLRKIAGEAKGSSWRRTISKAKKDGATPSDTSGGAAHASNTAPPLTERDNDEKSAKEMGQNEKSEDEIRADVTRIAQENERVQRELRAATDMMPVEDDGEGGGLSPEELLKSVLKFGEETEREERPGRGFVEGAFGKARELLRDEAHDEGSDPTKELDFGEPDSAEVRRRAEEEELRRIFAAGRSAAEKLSRSDPRKSDLARPSITDEDVNELIEADETVPRNARSLDDELAELEIRVSRSSQGGDDGPNEVFDVFSGPEVYDPNVDPETAVNWPGAKEGARTDVRLAADLSTALKQARFASAVLSRVREEVGSEGDDGEGAVTRYFVGERELTAERVTLLRECVEQSARAGIIEDPEVLAAERSRLRLLVDELASQPEERLEEIAANYKDLLLSDNLVDLMKERLHAMARRDLDARREGKEDSLKEGHARERAILMNLAKIAQALVREAQALGAELEVSMLEIIRSVCEVAMDPSHRSEEDTAAALTDAVRDMRPLLDDAFVAYLKYAVAEEEGKLARAGVLDDPEHNRWLFVLRIVQEGVYAELSGGVRRYVDHIWYVLRMKSKSERRELLRKLIDVMPTMDVRPFVKVVNNIVSSLGTTVRGDFADGVVLGEMTNQLLQLQRDVNELLPPERISELSKDADAWAAVQRRRLLERRDSTRQRLEAARKTGGIDPDEVIRRPGAEAERFD